MQRAVPLVAALALLAAAALFLFLKAGPDRGAAPADSATPEVPDAPIGPATLAAPATAAAEGSLPTAPLAEAQAALPGARASVSRRLEGRLRAPGGTVPEGVLVYAVAAGAGGVDAEEFGRQLLAERPTDVTPLARARADANGAFVLELHQDAPTLQIAALGPTSATRDFLAWSEGGDTPLELDLEARAEVTVVLEVGVDESVGPLAGRRVVVAAPRRGWQDAASGRRGGGETASGWTDASGRARVAAVPIGVARQARLAADDLVQTRAPIEALAAGERRTVRLDARRGGRVVGRLVDAATGAPVTQGEVSAREAGPFGGPGLQLSETMVLSPDGRFELIGVGAEARSVVIEGKGFLMKLERLERAPEDGETLDLGELALDVGASLAGTVWFPDGRPAADTILEARVDVASLGASGGMSAWRGMFSTSSADAEGRFRIAGLAPGARYDLTAGITGEETRWVGLLEGVAEGAENLRLELVAAPTIRGTVRTPCGEPYADAVVHAVPAGWTAGWGPRPPGATPVRSEADGTFVMRVTERGTFELRAQAEGFAESEKLVVEMGEDDPPIELALRPSLTVRGRVVDPSGAPVAGATIAPIASLLERARRGGDDMASIATSAADGRFELAGLPPGESMLDARHADYAVSEAVAVELTPDAPAPETTLTLRLGGRVHGVLYTQGKPAPAGKQVVANRMPEMEPRFADTLADGTFEFLRLTPGRWQVISMAGLDLTAEDGSSEDAMAAMMRDMAIEFVEVTEGSSQEISLGAPPASPVQVRGRVTASGEPLERGMVTFLPVSGGMSRLRLASLSSGGTYDVELPEAGEYMVTATDAAASGPGSTGSQVEMRHSIPEVESHVLDLELPVGAIRGRVTGPSGAPLEGAMVTWASEAGEAIGSVAGGGMGSTLSGADGRYELRFLQAGTYRVAAGGPQFGGMVEEAPVTGRSLREGLVLAAEEVLENVDFRLEQPGRVRGRVRDGAGKPVAGAAVFVRTSTGAVVDAISFVQSGADGAFTWNGLAPGRYTFYARKDDLASAESQPVTVRAGETAEVEIALADGAFLLLRVDDDDLPSGGSGLLRLAVHDDQGRRVSGTFALADIMKALSEERSADEQRFGPFVPGRYTASATDGTGRKAERSVELAPGQERRLRLRFKD